MITGGDLVTFGLLSSRAFMVWNRSISGRLKSDYNVGIKTTYNTFPVPEISEASADAIRHAAESVLEARSADSTLASMYDPRVMPPTLRSAHAALDVVVLDALGLTRDATDGIILERLFDEYARLSA